MHVNISDLSSTQSFVKFFLCYQRSAQGSTIKCLKIGTLKMIIIIVHKSGKLGFSVQLCIQKYILNGKQCRS